MGVDLAPVLQPRPLTFEALRGRVLAFDAATEMYPFLALLRRGPEAKPLQDASGRVTGHLNGLLMKITRLRGKFDVRPVYVFDGPPSPLKRAELGRRRAARDAAQAAHAAAVARGDAQDAWAKAVSGVRLDRAMIEDAQRLLDLLGVPWLRAPADAEAQCAHLAARGQAWAACSKDFDTLLYGAPRHVRFLSFQGREWLPSKGTFRDVEPELLVLEEQLARLRLTRAQFVDAALLAGTDFTPGVRGYGPKKAVAALRDWGRLEAAPAEVLAALGPWREARAMFLQPPVLDAEVPAARKPDKEGVVRFLVHERGFQEPRVRAALARLPETRPRSLDEFP